MEASDLEALVRRLRRGPVALSPAAVPVHHDRRALERVLPHRAPFLLVDRVTAIDLEGSSIQGVREVDPSDPVFLGHFPNDPVYPGVLLLEALGQLGLCLAHFVARARTSIEDGDVPEGVRIIKVHHATFLAAVRPGEVLTLRAELVEYDGYTGLVAGQVTRGSELCCVGVMEAYFVEG